MKPETEDLAQKNQQKGKETNFMNKVAKRLLTFFIGTPIILLIVFCDYLNHLPLQIVLGIFSVLGANEFYTMISKRNKLFTKEIVLIATVLLPFACYISSP